MRFHYLLAVMTFALSTSTLASDFLPSFPCQSNPKAVNLAEDAVKECAPSGCKLHPLVNEWDQAIGFIRYSTGEDGSISFEDVYLCSYGGPSHFYVAESAQQPLSWVSDKIGESKSVKQIHDDETFWQTQVTTLKGNAKTVRVQVHYKVIALGKKVLNKKYFFVYIPREWLK